MKEHIKREIDGKPAGKLLILGCSQRKISNLSPAPALHLYDGVNYRVLRKILLERGWPAGLQIKILSAKYKLIDATEIISCYDQRLDKTVAKKINKEVLAKLRKFSVPHTVFINLGRDYMPALNGLEEIFPGSKIIVASGGIGKKMQAMKRWLKGLNCRTSTLKRCSEKIKSYLYFFPDWDDFIYEPFTPEEGNGNKGRKTFAYEACKGKVPFDGILLSLAQINAGKGAVYRHANSNGQKVHLRRRLRIPPDILLFGDCGAFSYAGQAKPPFTSEQAAELYHKFGFDIGASVDHIPLPDIAIRQDDGSVRRKVLSKSARYERMVLTRDNAQTFIRVCKERDYRFTPLGVIQGLGVRSYVERVHEYLDMGYEHIALGGLVPRTDREIVEIVCAVRQEIQARTKGFQHNVWLHLFGILRPKIQSIFRLMGVSSFDSASYFRKAWLRSDQNYLAPDGQSWYGTIRIPISKSKPMRLAAQEAHINLDELAAMERRCLEAIEACNEDVSARANVTRSINKYGPLLTRRSEDNHFAEKHKLLLCNRPWEKCSCPFCRSAGMNVVVFRGAARNKRRGLHNTWVFYHKILHGDNKPNRKIFGKLIEYKGGK